MLTEVELDNPKDSGITTGERELAMIDQIAGLSPTKTESSKPDVVKKPDSESAPTPGNSQHPFDYEGDDETPGDGQPGKKQEGQAEGAEKTGGKTDQSAPKSEAGKDGEQPNTDAAKDEDAELEKMLGLTPAEPETVEHYRTKYQESSREAHKLQEHSALVVDMLAKKGVEVIRKSDGTLDLAPRKEYVAELKDEQLPSVNVYDRLPADQQALISDMGETGTKLVELISKTAAKETAIKLLAERPVVTAEAPLNVISDGEVNEALADLIKAKLPDGTTPRYPEAETERVQDLMNKVYMDRDNEGLRVWMLTNRKNFYTGLKMIYAQVANARVSLAIAKQAADRQRKENQEANRKVASITDGQGAIEPESMQTGKGKSIETQLLDQIVNAKPQ